MVAISFAVLGSGSSGNSTVVLLQGERDGTKPTAILIDAGLSPLATRKRLARFGLALTDLSAILITHFDTDHFGFTWPRVIEKLGMTVYTHHRHRKFAAAALGSVRQVHLFRDEFKMDGLAGDVATALAPHDEHGTVSFAFTHRGARFGLATDVGRVTQDVLGLMQDVDALAIESNYDPEMQRRSGRPASLRKRITSGQGHLSNAQSMEAVQEISCRSLLQHVTALHLSRQCNQPGLITALYAAEARPLLEKLTISDQFQPTPMMHVTPGSGSGNGRAGSQQPGAQHVLF